MRENTSDIINKLNKIASDFSEIHLQWYLENDQSIVSEPLTKNQAELDSQKLCRIFDTNAITIQKSSTRKNLYEIIVPAYLVLQKSPLESLPKLFMYLSQSDLKRLQNVYNLKDYVSEHNKDVAYRFSEENRELIKNALDYMNRELHADQWKFLKIESDPQSTEKVLVTRQSKITQKKETLEYSFEDILDYATQQKNWKKAA